VGIHVTNIRHSEFRKYEKPGLKQEVVDIMGYISFSPKAYAGIVLPRRYTFGYCTAHK